MSELQISGFHAAHEVDGWRIGVLLNVYDSCVRIPRVRIESRRGWIFKDARAQFLERPPEDPR